MAVYLKMKKVLKKKKQLIIGISLFLFFLIVFGIWKFTAYFMPVTAAQIILNPDNYIAVLKDNRYGYIDSNGKLKIDYQYLNAEDFVGDYSKVEQENGCAVINKKGTVLFTASDCNNISYYEKDARWIINGKMYDYEMNPIQRDFNMISYQYDDLYTFFNEKEKKFGLMNAKGKILFAMNSDDVSFYKVDVDSADSIFVGTYGVLQVNQKYMLFHILTGKIIIQFSDNPIVSLGNNIFEIQTSNGSYAIYVEENRILYQTEIGEKLSFYNVVDKILQITGKTTSYYDLENQAYLDSVSNITEQYASSEFEAKTSYHMIKQDGKYGLIYGVNQKKQVLPCEYEQIVYLDHTLYDYIHDQTGKNLIVLVRDNQMILFDLAHQHIVTTFPISTIMTNYESTFVLFSGEESILYNFLSNKKITVTDDVSIFHNYVKIGNTLYNYELRPIYSYE